MIRIGENLTAVFRCLKGSPAAVAAAAAASDDLGRVLFDNGSVVRRWQLLVGCVVT